MCTTKYKKMLIIQVTTHKLHIIKQHCMQETHHLHKTITVQPTRTAIMTFLTRSAREMETQLINLPSQTLQTAQNPMTLVATFLPLSLTTSNNCLCKLTTSNHCVQRVGVSAIVITTSLVHTLMQGNYDNQQCILERYQYVLQLMSANEQQRSNYDKFVMTLSMTVMCSIIRQKSQLLIRSHRQWKQLHNNHNKRSQHAMLQRINRMFF